MRYIVAVAFAAMLAATLSTSANAAWSEKNCLQTCKKTSSDLDPAGAYGRCVQNNNCAQYRGRPSATPASVRDYSAKWLNNRGLGRPRP
jgi:hypothetical protein